MELFESGACQTRPTSSFSRHMCSTEERRYPERI